MARDYRFFLSNPSNIHFLTSEQSFALEEKMEPEIFFQLMKVLRCKPGDRVTLMAPVELSSNTAASVHFEFHYDVASAQKKTIELEFVEKKLNDRELPFHLQLVLCLPNKPEKLEFILQKAVELGVNQVILVKGDFSQMKHELRPERLMKIMHEAAEQSERAGIPELFIEHGLGKFMEEHRPDAGQFFVAMERLQNVGSDQKSKNLAELLKGKLDMPNADRRNQAAAVSIIVGPEGGFSDEEKQLIQDLRISCFSLGKRILRMETAAILSLGIASIAGETAGFPRVPPSELLNL